MKRTVEEKISLLNNDPAWTTVTLPIEAGSEQVEEVLVERLDQDQLRVAASPGMIEGLAEGDIIEIDRAVPEGYRLVRRGRNICVHLFCEPMDVQHVRHRLEPLVEALGGWLDGTMGSSGLCFTIPVTVGFPAIESTFRSVVGENWYYSNVYDLTTDEPLNWWL